VLTIGTLAACGSSDESTPSTAATGATSASAQASGVNLAAARAVVDRYSSKPTPFPVDEPLKIKPAAGESFAYLQCGAPFCALLGGVMQGGAKMLGTPLEPVKADNSSDSIQAALSSIQSKDPAAMALPAVNLGALGDSLKKIADAGIPVVGIGVQAGPEQGLSASLNGPNNIKLAGKILADWAIVNTGPKREIVYYTIPELDFSAIELEAFKAELAKNCAGCDLRVVDVPLAATGTTAPSRVVSDLQANPGTEVAIFGSAESATGLAPALKTAGIDVKVNGFGPTPPILQDIKSGGITGALALDVPVMAFTGIDAMARVATKQPLTKLEQGGYIPMQLLDQSTVPPDPSKGWTGYPDFAERFAKLWAPAQG
jgi:ribose transport system substrate-binding protein